MKKDYIIYPLGDSAACIAFDSVFDEENYYDLYQLKSFLIHTPFSGYRESVLTFSELTIYFDLTQMQLFSSPLEQIQEHLIPFFSSSWNFSPQSSCLWDIPVCYNGEDLASVADYCKLSVSEVIRLHTNPIYKVYMIGFLPGFPYLGGLDARLSVPRKIKPRTIVKKGSVGLAGEQTGVYPLDSPGGWQLIGHTDFSLFDTQKKSPTTLKAGDLVKFHSI